MRRDMRMSRYLGYVLHESDTYSAKCRKKVLSSAMLRGWIDLMIDCLKKRYFDVGKARRIVHHGNEWGLFVKENA